MLSRFIPVFLNILSPYTFNDPIPNCVPEFYRARQESADREYESQAQAQEHYTANRQKLDSAAASGLPVLPYGGYGPCWNCPHADRDTIVNAEDDFDNVICRNPSCRLHAENQAKEKPE